MRLLPKEKEKSLLTNQQHTVHAQVMLEISKEMQVIILTLVLWAVTGKVNSEKVFQHQQERKQIEISKFKIDC